MNFDGSKLTVDEERSYTTKHSFIVDEQGQTLVLFAVGLLVLVGMLGLAIDTGQVWAAQTRLHQAAEAGAMAAGMEIRVCSGITNCPAMKAAVTSALVENGYTGGTFLQNCAQSADNQTLTLNVPPCALGSTDPNFGKKGFVEVVLTQQVPTSFMRLFGFAQMRVSARSEAARYPGPACIYALDPTAAGALSISVALGINSQCGMIVESSSPWAASCLIGLGVSAPFINVHGGAAGLLCSTTKVTTGLPVPTPADPLAYLPKPSVGSCGASSGNVFYGSPQAVNILLGGTYVFNPGVYCGGISMTAALLTNVTFNPGMYILKTGPGILGIPSGGLNLTVSLLSSIRGQNVTFYNYGPIGGISITAPTTLGLSNFSLTAPSSGVYGGVLFMQDPGNTSSGTFVASLLGPSKLEGAIYLPSASASYGVGAVSSAYTILVAKSIQFNVAVLSQFGNDYSALDVGSPLNGDRAALVQ
jgi:hypothetical protein